MASSLSFPFSKYDVFVCFNREDTGDNIVSHLLKALKTSNVHTFIDYELEKRDEIPPTLIRAIELSKISVIIFSENYAESRWCLDELVKILECRKELNQIVIPVFYKVDPPDVGNQTGKFGTVFDNLANNHEIKEGWRIALRNAANLQGWDLHTSSSEASLVKDVTADVLKKLGIRVTGLVGINSRVEEIIRLLDTESPEFRMVGIWGVGGIGKTPIAEAVFDKISWTFDGSCFMGNVRERAKKEGLLSMRNKLISELLNNKKLEIHTSHTRDSYTKGRLNGRKVLVVLDDVDDSSHLEGLIGKLGTDPFGRGSRVIVTTRDKHVLDAHDITYVYEMELLHEHEALHFLPSSSILSTKHDVFVSFRGNDTRANIVSHLDHAFQTKKIQTFIDEELRGIEEISQSLVRAVKKSKISLIVFSENYGGSKWCLDELVKILECRDAQHQIVIPVFYNVKPTHVRNQTGNFGTAFKRLLENIRVTKLATKEQIWRTALKYGGQLPGFVSSEIGSEAIMVDTIIAYVLEKLEMDSTNAYDDGGLVGINSRAKQIISLLRIGLPEFGVVGIWGMGGIGKTTIAKAIFRKISCQFESCCFLENITEIAKTDGLIGMKDYLISELLKDKILEIGTPHNGDSSIKEKLEMHTPHIGDAFIKDSIRSTRVLVVLDDVEHSLQLEALIGERGMEKFGPGSRVIVTTRDRQVLNAHDITRVYQMEMLHGDESLQLFHYHAFRYGQPASPYQEISKKIIEYAKGVPLALKVFGSSLRGKIDFRYWEGVLNKLKKVPNMIISDVLKTSYDTLDDEEKEIFLDIACFFKGTSIDTVINVLGDCYCSVHSGIEVLIDKSLMNISQRNMSTWDMTANATFDVVEMHELLQKMGWNIVIGESKKVGSRSRLWHYEDVCDVLRRNTGTERIKSILFDMSKVNEMNLAPQTFEKMYNLNFLKIMDSSTTYTEASSTDSVIDFDNSLSSESKIQFPSGLHSLPNGLKYLYWQNYPLEYLPPTFNPNNLVELHMSSERLKRLWSGRKNLYNLKALFLRFCTKLIEIPDLSLAENLEELRLISCESLVELPSSIQLLKNLVTLDVSNCMKLERFPNDINCISLTHLNLNGCPKINKFPYLSKNIKFLEVNGTLVEEDQSSIALFTQLVSLVLWDCTVYQKSDTFLERTKALTPLNCQITFFETEDKKSEVTVVGMDE